MTEINSQTIRLFRLYTHHLDMRREKNCIPAIAGACGMQNTPPGAWETALFNRISDCSLGDMNGLLYTEKSLLQAWSFRGAPVVFPAGESDVFLSALVPEDSEDWIYTRGISGALDFLQMPFDELLGKLKQVMPWLDDQTIESKSTLDQALAAGMLPLLPFEKRDLWNSPSMYGAPDRQTVGGAVVSFLLRPCAFLGLVVFGERIGISPTFTSYKGWLGQKLNPGGDAVKKLMRKFLHCYGPTTPHALASWLGCSEKQARRMWEAVSAELEPVSVCGKKAFILSEDKDLLCSPPSPQREWLLLGGHDPYLDQRDRHILLDDQALHKQVWKTVTNPGAILQSGEIVGIWTSKKKSKGIEVKMTLWKDRSAEKQKIYDLVEEYVVFRQEKLLKIEQ
ncbi:winged helix DNA-binding protein [Desulfitobacterium sp. LBE]|uniref:winged helix DNA-binding domain-containing protein n=1 Tax=Desulfitobacterium sp. LBE TaxID=884086 RepID=UPI001199B40D|nr:winged helix DNA-binding domain-containing protein [Desulfitobacterium sp. LBE]TWH60187.1 winged helix DNA-binding protein [Desulfitobacterium sp. LBE]